MSNLKTFFGIFFFLLALNNLQAGCPDLAGRYVCPSLKLKGIPVVEILQTPATDSRINYVLESNSGRTHLITDNVERTLPGGGHTWQAYCEKDENIDALYLVVTVSDQGGSVVSYSLNEEGSLQIFTMPLKPQTGQSPLEHEVCPKKN